MFTHLALQSANVKAQYFASEMRSNSTSSVVSSGSNSSDSSSSGTIHNVRIGACNDVNGTVQPFRGHEMAQPKTLRQVRRDRLSTKIRVLDAAVRSLHETTTATEQDIVPRKRGAPRKPRIKLPLPVPAGAAACDAYRQAMTIPRDICDAAESGATTEDDHLDDGTSPRKKIVLSNGKSTVEHEDDPFVAAACALMLINSGSIDSLEGHGINESSRVVPAHIPSVLPSVSLSEVQNSHKILEEAGTKMQGDVLRTRVCGPYKTPETARAVERGFALVHALPFATAAIVWALTVRANAARLAKNAQRRPFWAGRIASALMPIYGRSTYLRLNNLPHADPAAAPDLDFGEWDKLEPIAQIETVASWRFVMFALVAFLLIISAVTPDLSLFESALGFVSRQLLAHLVFLAFSKTNRVPSKADALSGIITISNMFLIGVFWDVMHPRISNGVLVFTHISCLLLIIGVCGYLSFHLSSKTADLSVSKQWPEYLSSLWARISFSWLNPLIEIANERPLNHDDLFELHKEDEGSIIYSRFSMLPGMRGTYSKGSLLKNLLRINYKILAYEFSISLVDHLFIFGGPFFIHNILKAIQKPDATSTEILVPVLGLLVASLSRTVCESQLYWVNRRIDVRLRACIVGTIYMKGLKRMQPSMSGAGIPKSSEGGTSYTDGAVSNLMSADTDKILACFRQSHYLLSVPLLLLLCFGLLVNSVGWAGAIAGMVSLSLAVPATRNVGNRIKKHRKDLMSKSDVRLSKLQEILNGMRSIKLFVWESYFRSQIDGARANELSSLQSYLHANMLTQLIWRCSPLIASAATFIAQAIVSGREHGVDAATAFTVLAMYNNVLRYPLFVIPKLFISLMELQVSMNRIEGFLGEIDLKYFRSSSSIHTDSVGSFDDSLNECGFKGNASFSYSVHSDEPVIKGLDFIFPSGKLSTIVGQSGSGKTSLLLALLGELNTISGRVITPANKLMSDDKISAISYAPQNPWLMNDTIRENIVFGAPFDQTRYNSVLDACALKTDLEALENGDQTRIGDRGSLLSGGQRQRVSLARAVYSDSRVVLMDDVLSAVDAKTAKHILHHCLLGPLMANRTRILVTHAVDMCLGVSEAIVVMQVGGSAVFAEGDKSHLKNALDSIMKNVYAQKGADESQSLPSDTAVSTFTPGRKQSKNADKMAATTKASLGAYKFYLSSSGGLSAGILFVLSILMAYAFGFLHDYTLKLWSDSSKGGTVGGSSVDLVSYGLAAFLAVSALYVRFTYQIVFSTHASEKISGAAMERLLKAPLSVFESTNSGQIMNRFGKDTQVLDQEVASSIGETVQQVLHGIMVSGMISFASPVLCVFAIPIAILYIPIARKFMAVMRSLKRLEASSRSPVYSAFGETLALAFRVEVVGALVSFGAGSSIAFAASGKAWGLLGAVDPGWAGLILNYSSMFTDVLTWIVRNSAQMEMTFTSVERLQEYTVLSQEEIFSTRVERVPENVDSIVKWPKEGKVVFDNLGIRYKTDAPLAVNIRGQLTIHAGESVGIVGRTGSGKSTLGMSLARPVLYERGSIKIDDLDISLVGLSELRKRIVIIPQEPFLFAGTVRENLDPTNVHKPATLQRALDAVAGNHANAPSLALDAVVAEGGANLSGGQRQMISLARAVVNKWAAADGGINGEDRCGIILMDEATASLDSAADETMQQALRVLVSPSNKNGKRWTVIAIAHRLSTVMDMDRVVVMRSGEVAEEGHPRELISRGAGLFYELVQQSR
ncbi:hypothetical protein HDU83_000246 [Entophlyctis luteolus]|nr:hypothetical protein HDU83_000246 [Entophlyctis luteolus]